MTAAGTNAPLRPSPRRMTRKQRRLTLIGIAGAVLAVAAGLVLYALTDRITFFNSPSDIQANSVAPGQRIRLGGLVKEGSVKRGAGTTVSFEVTDGASTIAVAYTGILPDLFREGQGVVTEGALQADGHFKAETVLAKHDETYMPKEVADSLKKGGHWQGEKAKPANN
jgi:cytochrome c-type biogenesis protein CcmE